MLKNSLLFIIPFDIISDILGRIDTPTAVVIIFELDISFMMNKVCNLHSYIERKLFTLNTAHSMTAYLGFNKGYETIFESINDPYIYKS